MRAKHFLIADTETVGLKPVNFVYDFGYVITTRKEIKLERSFLVQEIITDAEKMMGAYFAKKIFSHYIPTLDAGEIHLHTWASIVMQLREDMESYDVDVFCAYNLPFDMGAIAATNKLLSLESKVLEYKPDLLDLYYWACSGALNTRLYHDTCMQQNNGTNWISAAGNYRSTAEKAYAFLSGDLEFIESHTALQDAQIETKIFHKLSAKKGVTPYNKLVDMPWKKAQIIAGNLI